MYYKRVNRGLRFTKPGLYSFGLLLAVGMIAIATGINGLYIFLSAGLGGFIVSGLLSERIMKISAIRSIEPTTAHAGEPFTLRFSLANTSPSYAAHALRTAFVAQRPGFRLLARPIEARGAHYQGCLPAASVTPCSASCVGMPRGTYDQLLVMQTTTFPFGMLEKFKLVEATTRLVITPAVDAAYYQEVKDWARQAKVAADSEREFFSHRPYQARDGIRALDWKKSAGLRTDNWVAKVYRSQGAQTPVVLEADWHLCRKAGSAAAYEHYITLMYTAARAVKDMDLPVVLDATGLGQFQGIKTISETLAALPEQRDTARLQPVPSAAARETPSSGLRLSVKRPQALTTEAAL